MNNEDFPIIEQYFHKALALPMESRFEFITQNLPDQPEIQKAIISLLQHTQETQLLKQIVGKVTHSVFDTQQDLSGTMAGAYKLIECIKTGGMGAVYLGERADKQYEKKVAVKLIKSMNTSDYFFARFKEERQILADLEHQNITRLVDGGTTEAGVPFLVMEYVEGIPIDQYCEQNQLTLKQQLKIFIKVCEAIQYAHQNLVVHCDIKPENILVNQDGEPKVMDFGISHLLNKTELDTDAPRMLTLQYASPEQISGGIISVSSDIYSLGAVLYKMLSGAVTFPVNINNKDTVLDYIQSKKIAAVSEQANHSELSHYKNIANLICADLDAIVAKALQAKGSDRYSSASSLAEDISRLLEQKPVQARPANWPHRSYLFFRRNLLPVALGAVLSVSVLSASAIIWYQSIQVKMQRDIAQQERNSAQAEQQKAQAVTNFITDMFKSIDPDKAQGNEVTVYDVLQSAIEKLKDPVQSTLTEQPMVLAKIRHTIGDIFFRIGKIPEAIKQLELANGLHQANTGEDIAAHIATLNTLSNAFSRVDRHSDRGPILEAITVRAYELYGKEHIHTIGYALNLGGYYNDTGKHQRAIDTHLQVLEDAKQYLGEQNIITVLALASLSNDYLEYGDIETSLNYFLEALALA
ncbi:MAG: serine/threonine protein kinase, partial [Paraglaciecola sp.]|nr:serine/threonine protein kinase [Paraglaciecola sp.]